MRLLTLAFIGLATTTAAAAETPLAKCLLDKQLTATGVTDIAIDVEVRSASVRIGGQETLFPATVTPGEGQGLIASMDEDGLASNTIQIGATGVVAWVIQGTDGTETTYIGMCEFV